ncbi:MAG TPA: hypothetical protein VG826_15045 [Pirellulales bacterium]|nr:hypothetical protein [Pirellulales bacterium]
MHNRLLLTLDAPADAGSEQVREDAFDRLMDDNSFCGEGGRFGGPICDWFVIGGRWSGLLTETTIGDAYRTAAGNEQGAALDAVWSRHGGAGPSPTNRDSYEQLGYVDDAMIVSEALYNALLAENEGIDTDCQHFADLDGEEVSRGFIGRKWLVVVDYHH